MLGALLHTQTAAVALVGVDRKSLAIVVEEALHTTFEGQCRAFGRRQHADAKHFVRTHADAVFLAFAAIAIDHRHDFAGFVLAVHAIGAAHRARSRSAVLMRAWVGASSR